MESTVTVKGQFTIPKAIRNHLRLKPGRSRQGLYTSRRLCRSLAKNFCFGAAGDGQVSAEKAFTLTFDHKALRLPGFKLP